MLNQIRRMVTGMAETIKAVVMLPALSMFFAMREVAKGIRSQAIASIITNARLLAGISALMPTRKATNGDKSRVQNPSSLKIPTSVVASLFILIADYCKPRNEARVLSFLVAGC